MNVGNKEIESIVVVNKNDEVIAIISDKEIVENKDYKVIIEPTK